MGKGRICRISGKVYPKEVDLMPNKYISQATILAALQAELPAYLFLSRPEELAPYSCDGLSVYQQSPLLVALPESVEQIQAIMRICHTHHVPVVARGAGTSLSGGALPHADGVLLSLAKFQRILAINPENRSARMQPGVCNLAISEKVY